MNIRKLAHIIKPANKATHKRPRLMEGDYRDDVSYRVNDYPSRPIAMRYHVTREPVFAERDSLTSSSGEAYVFKYVEFKLMAMDRNGDYPRNERPTLYVWDVASPSGTLMPIAKLELIDGEVKRT